MNIFIGTQEVASVLYGVNEGFRKSGFKTTTYNSNRNVFYQHSYNIRRERFLHDRFPYSQKNIPKALKAALFRFDNLVTPAWLRSFEKKIIREHDLFVFIWQPWLPEWEVFQKIKDAGKKIICLQLGSDVRHILSFHQQYSGIPSYWEKEFHEEDLNLKVKKIRYQELYADAIFSVPDQAGLSIRPYSHLYLPIADSKNISPNVPGRNFPVILHAPSRTGIKGTHLIVAAVEELKKEGLQFDFKFLQGMPNIEVIKALMDADILVDELFLHGPGVLSFEAMAAGCAVATHCLPDHKDVFNPPVVNINAGNLKESIRMLITDKSFRAGLAEQGIDYARTHNASDRVAKRLIDTLQSGSVDYYPEFYLKQFELPEGVALSAESLLLSTQVADKYVNDETLTKSAISRQLLSPYTI